MQGLNTDCVPIKQAFIFSLLFLSCLVGTFCSVSQYMLFVVAVFCQMLNNLIVAVILRVCPTLTSCIWSFTTLLFFFPAKEEPRVPEVCGRAAAVGNSRWVSWGRVMELPYSPCAALAPNSMFVCVCGHKPHFTKTYRNKWSLSTWLQNVKVAIRDKHEHSLCQSEWCFNNISNSKLLMLPLQIIFIHIIFLIQLWAAGGD